MPGARKLAPKKLPFNGNITPRLRLYLQACVAIGRKLSNKSPPSLQYEAQIISGVKAILTLSKRLLGNLFSVSGH